jgi:hypothetical protein
MMSPLRLSDLTSDVYSFGSVPLHPSEVDGSLLYHEELSLPAAAMNYKVHMP